MTDFPLWNTKEEFLKNVSNVFVHTLKVSGVQNNIVPCKFLFYGQKIQTKTFFKISYEMDEWMFLIHYSSTSNKKYRCTSLNDHPGLSTGFPLESQSVFLVAFVTHSASVPVRKVCSCSSCCSDWDFIFSSSPIETVSISAERREICVCVWYHAALGCVPKT